MNPQKRTQNTLLESEIEEKWKKKTTPTRNLSQDEKKQPLHQNGDLYIN